MQNTIVKLVTDVNDGHENPLKAYALLRQWGKDIDSALKEIEEYALLEAKKYPKTFEQYGFEFTRSEGARRFDFKGCQSWVKTSTELKEIEERLKATWNLHQKIGQVASAETGEELELPVCNFGKESLTIKIKKA